MSRLRRKINRQPPAAPLLNRRAVCLAIICSLYVPALADRERLTFSDVIYNAQTGTLNVTHRLHLHDAQQAMVKAGLLDNPDLVPLIARAKLALFVGGQFTIEGIALELLGAQIDGNYVYIYQQAEMDKPPERLEIKCEILRAAFPDQTNHVNVTHNDAVQSLIFAKQDGVKSAL